MNLSTGRRPQDFHSSHTATYRASAKPARFPVKTIGKIPQWMGSLPSQTPGFREALVFAHDLQDGLSRMEAVLGQRTICMIGSNNINSRGRHRKMFQAAVDLTHDLAAYGWNFICGVRPGVYDAIPLGAHAGNKRSEVIGIGIAHGKRSRSFVPGLDEKIMVRYSQIRKVLRSRFSTGYVFFPGGYETTIDLLFEVLTLRQTGKIDDVPIFCFDTDFWKHVLPGIMRQLEKHGAINAEDKDLVVMTDDPKVIHAGLEVHLRKMVESNRPNGGRNGNGKISDFPTSVALEMLDAAYVYRDLEEGIPIYGSARIKEDTAAYKLTVNLSKILGQLIIAENKDAKKIKGMASGGGPGIMQATNEGANAVGCPSIAYGIHLPFEQEFNDFVDPDLAFNFQYFFVRKYFFRIFTKRAFILGPIGGFGTFDELGDMLVVNQRNRQWPRRIYAFDPLKFWEQMFPPICDHLRKCGFIRPGDERMIHYTSDPFEIARGISPEHAGRIFG